MCGCPEHQVTESNLKSKKATDVVLPTSCLNLEEKAVF